MDAHAPQMLCEDTDTQREDGHLKTETDWRDAAASRVS